MANSTDIPVLLVHGWGGSFDSTWRRSGFTDLLADAGRRVIGVDLLGHGEAPKPTDPVEYTNLGTRILEALPAEPVDAIGFSLGASTLLCCAAEDALRFNRLVLAGIGRNVFERDLSTKQRIIAALEGTAPDDDTVALLFAQYADQPGNNRAALLALMQAPESPLLTAAELAAVTCPTLIAVGEQDFVMPADRLVDALPDATLVPLAQTDHFKTPKSFAFFDAALDFIDAAV